MINIGLYYTVKLGSEKEFENRFDETVLVIKNSGFGCVDARLYKDVKKQNEYLLYTEWKNIDGFINFIKSDAYKKTVEAGKSIIEGMPRHRIFTEFQNQSTNNSTRN